MRKSALSALLLVAALALSACVSITPAPAGPFKVGSSYEVTLGRDWSDISKLILGQPKKVRMLSTDGPLLNRLYLVEGLAPGEFLVKPATKETPTPTYRSGMSPTERVEFVAESAAALGYQRVETKGLRPVRFGSVDGMRFELTATTKEGLNIKGLAQVAEHGGQLYVILYLAPGEHYYGANLAEVEGVMNSARLGG